MLKEKKRFSLIARLRSTNHAWRGIGVLFKTTHNVWVHTFCTLLVVYLGFSFNISSLEWVAIVLAIGLVFVSEAFNTAIEVDMDLTSPDYHPYAKDTKDISAGAVLISVLFAVIIGSIVFIPKVVSLL
ncbi:MAG: diacylglycerol kinase [Patescibacteria group bacterium]|nr:diacylglycerol kinase family protein [Candidatus Paceibacterota bacterium]MDQ5922718.1 diacylglycerol kinase [Patescibacteria group bacterium]